MSAFEAEHGIIPIPLRENVTVRVSGLPRDLTEKEAAKIGAVIAAFIITPAGRSALKDGETS